MAFTSPFSRPPTAAARSSIRSASARAAAIPEKRRSLAPADRAWTRRLESSRSLRAIRIVLEAGETGAKLQHTTPEARDEVGTSAPDAGGARRLRPALLITRRLRHTWRPSIVQSGPTAKESLRLHFRLFGKLFLDRSAHPRRSRLRPQLAPDVARTMALGKRALDRTLDAPLFLGPAEVREHHARGEQRRERVRDVLAGERRGRAVHRLEQRHPLRVARRGRWRSPPCRGRPGRPRRGR